MTLFELIKIGRSMLRADNIRSLYKQSQACSRLFKVQMKFAYQKDKPEPWFESSVDGLLESNSMPSNLLHTYKKCCRIASQPKPVNFFLQVTGEFQVNNIVCRIH